MAAGDATRIWFKSVDTALVSRWRKDLSGAELAALAADLTEITTRYREEQRILPPVYFCRRCGTSARAKSPVIHVGSMIFAAKRLGLIGDAEVSQLQVLWRRYAARQRRSDQACESQKQLRERDDCH